MTCIGGPGGPGSTGGPGCTTGGPSSAGLFTTAGGIGCGGGGGGDACGTSESWKPVPGTTGTIGLVAPTRNAGRAASNRDARNAGDGSASANTATPSGSFGRALNPAGSI